MLRAYGPVVDLCAWYGGTSGPLNPGPEATLYHIHWDIAGP